MPRIDIVRETAVARTPRVLQLEGMFDLPVASVSRVEIAADLDLPDDWSVGLIVGPSGAGKSTVARELFGAALDAAHLPWPSDRSIVDAFPEEMGIKEVTELLSSVGFSSPPAWLRPFQVLSNGEQFRASLARILATHRDLAVVDEFTSVIDRNVARIGSHAVAKAVRRRGGRFVAISCHYDIADWLDPDWIYEPHINRLTRRSLRGRPAIDLVVRRVHRSAWDMFVRHHYLSAEHHRSAKCFVAFADGEPAAFCSFIHHPHMRAKNIKRGHRLVCLPDYQGIGIANALLLQVASMVRAMQHRFIYLASHPAMIRSYARSADWNMRKAPNFSSRQIPKGFSREDVRVPTRLRATFEFVGAPMDAELAGRLWRGE